MRAHLVHGLGLLSLAWTLPTHAQETRPTLQLQVAQPGSVISVERLAHGKPHVLLRCTSSCSTDLPRGRYRLLLESPDRSEPAAEPIRLREPTLYISRPAYRTEHGLGVAMIALGGVAAGTGIVSLSYALFSQMCEGMNCGAKPRYLWYGVGATPIGTVLLVGGLIIVMATRKPSSASRSQNARASTSRSQRCRAGPPRPFARNSERFSVARAASVCGHARARSAGTR